MEKTETHKATDTKTCEFDITKEETTKELDEIKKENKRLKKVNRKFRLGEENRRLQFIRFHKEKLNKNENRLLAFIKGKALGVTILVFGGAYLLSLIIK